MKSTFQLVALGTTGGPFENNLSGYLLSPIENQQWIALDAGSLLGGIECALAKNSFKHVNFVDEDLLASGEMLMHHIRAFLISHAHLDHILGLVITSQANTKKSIIGIDPTIDNLRDHIFNGKIWPNYGNEGSAPINRFDYIRAPFEQRITIPGTDMQVESFLLHHPGSYPSTAFLISYQERCLLYFGDTSSDCKEEEKRLLPIWQRIAPLVRENKLCGILLECSYPEKNSDQPYFGHLDSKLMLNELKQLETLVGRSLEGLKVMVTHRKQSLKKGEKTEELIKQQLLANNTLKLEFLFPNQGEYFVF